MISSTQNEEMSSGNDEKEAELDAEAKQEAAGGMLDFRYALRKFRKDCENFATITKISQSLRKFLYAHFFAKLVKFRYHSENYCAYRKFEFRYALYFCYDSEIHCIARIIPLCFLFQTTLFCLITILSLL